MDLISIIDKINNLPYVGNVIFGSRYITVNINKESIDDCCISTIQNIIGKRHFKIFASGINNDAYMLRFDRDEYGK